MSAEIDTTEIDAHECKLTIKAGHEERPPAKQEFVCEICGTTTTPAIGVKKAKRNRKW